ncbi:MAG: SIR2 family protein [Polyangiaceae bacterium]
MGEISSVTAELDAHFSAVAKAFADGRVVPFFGAGVNCCGRPDGVPWDAAAKQSLPTGRELANYLAKQHSYPEPSQDLLRVSQFIAVTLGSGPLYNQLHDLFDNDYPPTPLHQFFALMPKQLRTSARRARGLLIVTTNYDDLMERAMRAAGEPFDLVSYVAEGDERGRFLHTPADGSPARIIKAPNKYQSLSTDKNSIILKVHGAVDRVGKTDEERRDSFVITEDDYIDYLGRISDSNLLPVSLVNKIRHSHILFLGYGLGDWNLRAILHRIWAEQRLKYNSWAVQKKPDKLEQKFWQGRQVEIMDIDLNAYVAAVQVRLEEAMKAVVP